MSEEHSRCTFLTASLAASVASLAQTSSGGHSLLEVDYRRLVSRADLTYEKPAARSEEGLLVGNGRMMKHFRRMERNSMYRFTTRLRR
jgi:hypothetical protein